jgi:hypothetical protein
MSLKVAARQIGCDMSREVGLHIPADLTRAPSKASSCNVMLTIFGDFRQFSAKKLAFFSKTNAMIKILNNLALF